LENFCRYFNQLEDYRMAGAYESVEALWAKAPGQLLRLAAPLQVLRSYFRIDNTTKTDTLPTTKFALCRFQHRVAITNSTLQLAMQLLMIGKTTAEETHRSVEDPHYAVASRFLDVARKRQGKKGGPVSLREIAKSGWPGKKDGTCRRPAIAELRQLAAAAHAQNLLVFDEKSNTVTVTGLPKR
jgi:hypothetical protein